MKLKDIINRIGYYRNNKKLSARELSILINKSENYINILESKEFKIPTDVLLDILEVLEVTPEEFFADNYQTYKNDKELLQLIKSLPADKKEHLIKFIKNK